MSVRHWGPHFPDAASSTVKHWSIHFPDGGQDPAVLAGYGPPGNATLVLDLEQGFTIRQQWRSDVEKMRSGKERRISILDAPKRFFNGDAFLAGDDPRAVRAKLARFAAIGGLFLIGLPHEQLTINTDSSGTSVFVNAAALGLVDWNKPGQRCVVARKSWTGTTWQTSFVNAVIQSSSGGTVVLDVAPGTIGKVGAVLMPAVPVYFEPQQDFARYPIHVERWKLNARAAIFDYAPTLASLALGPLTVSGAFAGASVTAREFGNLGNQRSFALVLGGPAAGSLTEGSGLVQFNYQAGVTTMANLQTVLNLSSYVILTGTWTGSQTIAAGDAFGQTPLGGGNISGDVGTGATLTTVTLDGVSRPVWDRSLFNDSTGSDGIHAMTQIIDHGALPYSLQTADRADWYRYVRLASNDQIDWQWWKLLTSTTVGSQRAFWLSTWRDDFTFVSKATNTVTVSTTDGSDFFGWWPDQRQYLQIVQADGTVTRCKVTAAVDNGNGTATLTVGVTLTSSAVTLVSWLELCRFESDDFSISWSGEGFQIEARARVVQQ